MKRYNTIEPGTPVWMIKVSNLKTPKHIVIEKGFVSYADDYQYWIAFSCKKAFKSLILSLLYIILEALTASSSLIC